VKFYSAFNILKSTVRAWSKQGKAFAAPIVPRRGKRIDAENSRARSIAASFVPLG
jgi:hypothetical protein